MSLPSDRIKQINLPNLSSNGTVLGTTTYDIVPEMLGKNGFAAELPSLEANATIALTSDLSQYASQVYVMSAISALTYASVGAASATHTHTYSDVGALSAATHIPSDPVNADWSATTGLSSILNKPTLGTAASMASTAFRSASWMPTYTDVGALSSSTFIPSVYGDVGAASAAHNHDGRYLSNSTDITTALGYTPISSAGSQVNADWSATSGVASILNKPVLGTAASMASTAFRASTWTPTYADVGALSSSTFIPSVYGDVGAASAAHSHTYSDVGALSAATHIPSDPVNADWNATTGLSSIKNKPTLGTAASMNSTAFRPASWMPTYSDVGALSSATVIPSTYSDVGAASASHTHTDYVERSGDTMTGQLVAQNNIAYTTAQVRNIILSTSEPTSSDGANGDIWIVYKE